MKKFTFLIAFLACLVCPFKAYSVSNKLKLAQNIITEYLENKKRAAVEIDKRDNSVNFFETIDSEKILYWITFEEVGKSNTLAYTLHRKPIKFESQDANKNNLDVENAEIATNYINENSLFKTYVKGNRMEFVFTVLATSPTEYVQILDDLLSAMRNVKSKFNKSMKDAINVTDSIHNYWVNNNPDFIVVKQKTNQSKMKDSDISISEIAFRNVDANGNEISGYDQDIKKTEAKYIQPKITIKSQKGTYNIGVRIITPDNKILIPELGTNLSTVTPISVGKEKNKEIELEPFGSMDGSIWEEGKVYKVEFIENGKVIRTGSFSIR